MMLTFFICHMFGISCACSNPVLYGFLNDNFAKGGHSTQRPRTIRIMQNFGSEDKFFRIRKPEIGLKIPKVRTQICPKI
jgi:hypothetical protein